MPLKLVYSRPAPIPTLTDVVRIGPSLAGDNFDFMPAYQPPPPLYMDEDPPPKDAA